MPQNILEIITTALQKITTMLIQGQEEEASIYLDELMKKYPINSERISLISVIRRSIIENEELTIRDIARLYATEIMAKESETYP